jgi:mRNA-degrading endonuclease HigB of HigAB toxin-antitoxin module
MNILLELQPDQEDKITKEALLRAMSTLENSGTELDIDTYDALSQSLAYFSTPEELKRLSNRTVPKRWNEIVVNARA